MAKEKKVSKIKVKKKRWFPILAPKFLGGREIGESYLNQAEMAVGRMMKINLRDLTGNVSDQNISISLIIKEMAGNNLQTEVRGYSCMSFFIKKMSRRNAGKIDDSFILRTKDDKAVRLKPMTVTVFPVNQSIKTALRKRVRELFEEEAEKMSFDSLVNDLLKYKLQMEFKKKMSKICPVRDLIMRVVKLEEGKRARLGGKKERKQATVMVEENTEREPAEEETVKKSDKKRKTTESKEESGEKTEEKNKEGK